MHIFDFRYLRHFDVISFILIITLSLISLLFVFSSTATNEKLFSPFFIKQLIGIGFGFIIYFITALSDYRILYRLGYIMYAFIVMLLLFTLLKGSIGMGAQRWINLGFFKFQPSELAKLFLPGMIAMYFYHEKDNLNYRFSDYIPALIIIVFSSLLIIKQPDLGTGLLILFSGFILLWAAGLSRRFFIYSLILFSITAPLSLKLLKPYQRQRIMVFLGAGSQANERYQIEQSKIAIGSGGFFGKGLRSGTQNTLFFLPESRTDFIFSVIGEEWGFVGTLFVILLYVLLFSRMLLMCLSLRLFHDQLLALGLMIHIALSALINIAMVSDLLPIVGIPLPFISYGLTHIWISFASLGWFQSIVMRRHYLGG